ncbi:unnamed protein product [Angiostrongylus costaricensis]|uniref:Importin N-terminal domain-containing protein n=1 Tax=Angiostrongylus costaricensis TaxID=334426 RepID=A0A158PEQ9_ANGCS|nr:unnamed protein product [Angiostrongylus costaricensis]
MTDLIQAKEAKEGRVLARTFLGKLSRKCQTYSRTSLRTSTMDLQCFHQVILHMQSANNAERDEAEDVYNKMELAPKASLLFSLYCTADAPFEVPLQSRTMCLILLRRLLSNCWTKLWEDLGANQKSFTDQLINMVMTEPDGRLRRKLLAVVSEAARYTVDDETGKQKWVELIQFLEHCMSSDNVTEIEYIVILLESVPNIFGVDQDHYIPRIKESFSTLLKNERPEIRSSAFKAYVTFVIENEDDNHLVREMSSLMPLIVEVCRYACTHNHGDDSPLQCLCDLETAMPKLVNPYLSSFLEMCIECVLNVEKDEAYRHSATEVLATICERSTAVLKKRYSQSIFFICKFGVFCYSSTEGRFIESYVAQVSCPVYKTICAFVDSVLFSIFCAQEEWQERHVAVMGFSVIGEGCQRVMEPQIDQIVREILPFLDDKHPRVRYAACNALGQMSSDFAPALQKRCHELVWLLLVLIYRVVPALMATILDVSCDRVSAHAAAALINFCEDCPKQIISAYLPAIVNGLEQALGNAYGCLQSVGKKLRCEQIVTAIASVADAAQDLFVEFYDRLVPNLKYILLNSTADKYRILRGKTLESLSLIGVAVGKEKFHNDAIAIMDLMRDSMPSVATDHPEYSYLVCSWTRICKVWDFFVWFKVLGKEFSPYLPMIMGHVLQSAAYKPEVAVVEEDQYDKGDPAWSYHSVGDNKSFGIRTAGLDEKSDSCAMLVCYARDLEVMTPNNIIVEEFLPYVNDVAKLSIENLRFLFVDSVRCSAAETLPWLLKCVKGQGIEAMRQLWLEFFPAICSAVDTESELEVVERLMDSLAECVLQFRTGVGIYNFSCCHIFPFILLNNAFPKDFIVQGLTNEDIEKIVEVLAQQLKKHEIRRVDAEAEAAEEVDSYDFLSTTMWEKRVVFFPQDADPDDMREKLSEEAEMEGEMLARFSDLIHNMFETVGERFFDYIEPLVPEFLQLIDIRRAYPSRQYGVCYIDDCIEFAPKRCAKYQEQFVPLMLRCLTDDYPEVRQAAAYGFGVMGMVGGNEYLNTVTNALEPLAAMVSSPDARSTEESSGATDNGIAAVAKILKYSGANIDVAQVVPAFLSWLPTHEDVAETPHIYGYLADLIESNHPVVLGEDNCNLPRIVFIIVSAFNLEAFPPTEEGAAVGHRLRHILKVLHSNSAMFEAVVQAAQLDEKKRKTLHDLIS